MHTLPSPPSSPNIGFSAPISHYYLQFCDPKPRNLMSKASSLLSRLADHQFLILRRRHHPLPLHHRNIRSPHRYAPPSPCRSPPWPSHSQVGARNYTSSSHSVRIQVKLNLSAFGRFFLYLSSLSNGFFSRSYINDLKILSKFENTGLSGNALKLLASPDDDFFRLLLDIGELLAIFSCSYVHLA
ncbi:hypothetical protein L2E82_37242 [Cichorium intybus]|uniref:Uncharacterized protein n=1 Tax=Cichorium intybus TaxID=13427 RepID=A0ACB9AD69_CICIN|nr:hypothetical protein L2E82_37242 [Cichorium intybus]